MDNLSDNHQRTKWRDRAVCLRSELVLLLADRMQFPDPALFWDNIAMITKPGHVQQVTANGSGGGFSEEVMALRTKLVMAQQDLQRRAADVRDTNQKMQAAVAERDKLQVMYNDLRCNLDPATQDQQAKAVRECGALREHARTLSMNLESHARVVENLISLNSELMDAANLRALESQMKADVEQGSGSAVPLLDK
ncbi:hypothetical protein WJX75_008420 [Coccomyxa subellipsoidea]|uniref:Uncharacterized protein n=1 Tax=Coccomyxa subellipsoidea TaxID=248742 RepID=A0ABR2YRH1_9CHLO